MDNISATTSTNIKLDYEGIKNIANQIQDCGNKYQGIADTFKAEVLNLKNNILTSGYIDNEMDKILNEVMPVLEVLKRNCDSYYRYLNELISSFKDTDLRG